MLFHLMPWFYLWLGGFVLLWVVDAVWWWEIKTYNKINHEKGMTALSLAEKILHVHEIQNVILNENEDTMSPYYDMKKKELSLWKFETSGMHALTLAAHESFHAWQDKRNYFFAKFREKTVLKVLILPFVMIIGYGFFLYYHFEHDLTKQHWTALFLNLCYFFLILYRIISVLPLEFDANIRAYRYLKKEKIMTKKELKIVRTIYMTSLTSYILSTPCVAIFLR